MKVLHVVATCDAATGGGVAERTRELSKALVAQGVECDVLTLDLGLDARRRDQWQHVNLRILPCLNERFFVPGGWPGRIASAVAVADVVELTSHWTALNALAFRAARSKAIPHIVHPAGALGIVGRSVRIKRAYNCLIGTRMIRSASGHVAITRAEAMQYAAYGVSDDRVTFIPNGVSAPPAPVDPQPFLRKHDLEGRRLILFAGRLSTIKGPDLLLEAFADLKDELSDYTLVFAGADLGLGDSLHQFAADRGISNRIRFVGYLEDADREAAYQACEFLALPSRREAMSLVALEAGVRGKAVLLTDQCGFDEIEACGGGVMVEATVGGLREGLRAMVGQHDRLPEMGCALQTLVRRSYTWSAAADTYSALCRTILSGSPPRTPRR